MLCRTFYIQQTFLLQFRFKIRATVAEIKYVKCKRITHLQHSWTSSVHKMYTKQTWHKIYNVEMVNIFTRLFLQEELYSCSRSNDMALLCKQLQVRFELIKKKQTKNYYYNFFFCVSFIKCSHWITKMRSKCTSSQVQSYSLINCVCAQRVHRT